MIGSAERRMVGLIIREIIFVEFQRVRSQSTNVTDGQTDNLSCQYRATRKKYRAKRSVAR